MKSFKKALVGLAVAAACASGAQAALNNVGGVIWDPLLSGIDFSGVSTMTQNIGGGGVVSGYAYVNSLNNTNVATFCPGCELTITYSGFTPNAAPSTFGAFTFATYTGGTVDFWVDHAPNTAGGTSTNGANYGDGVLWASFTATPANNLPCIGSLAAH